MTNNISISDKDFFKKNGYLIIKNAFKKNEVNNLIFKIKKTFNIEHLLDSDICKSKKSYKLTDGVTKTNLLWSLIYNDTITKTIKSIYDANICYAQHSDLHINNRGGRWHRDSRCRVFGQGTDWDETKDKYGIVRVAIYLSDFKTSNSSIIIFPKSHILENFIQKFEFRLINKIISLLKKYNIQEYFPNFSFTRKLVKHNTNAGDIVIFDQRVVHGSGNIGISKKMPKYSIFLAYGLNNQHTINHKKYYVDEKNLDYQKKIDTELLNILKKNKLDFLYK